MGGISAFSTRNFIQEGEQGLLCMLLNEKTGFLHEMCILEIHNNLEIILVARYCSRSVSFLIFDLIICPMLETNLSLFSCKTGEYCTVMVDKAAQRSAWGRMHVTYTLKSVKIHLYKYEQLSGTLYSKFNVCFHS